LPLHELKGPYSEDEDEEGLPLHELNGPTSDDEDEDGYGAWEEEMGPAGYEELLLELELGYAELEDQTGCALEELLDEGTTTTELELELDFGQSSPESGGGGGGFVGG
jgi:hypothetical protein